MLLDQSHISTGPCKYTAPYFHMQGATTSATPHLLDLKDSVMFEICQNLITRSSGKNYFYTFNYMTWTAYKTMRQTILLFLRVYSLLR
jgi:hypothetical protein